MIPRGFLTASALGAGLMIAGAGYAQEAAPQETVPQIPHSVLMLTDDPSSDCVVGYTAQNATTANTQMLEDAIEILNQSQILAPVMEWVRDFDYVTCLSDRVAPGANAISLSTQTGPTTYDIHEVVTANPFLSQFNANYEDIDTNGIAVMLAEEYAHAMFFIALVQEHDMMAFRMMSFSPRDNLQISFAQEAYASTLALMAAYELRDNGHPDILDTMESLNKYPQQRAAIEAALSDNPNALTNGTAFEASFRAWFDDEELSDNYMYTMLRTYQETSMNLVLSMEPTTVVMEQNFEPDTHIATVLGHAMPGYTPSFSLGDVIDEAIARKPRDVQRALQSLYLRAADLQVMNGLVTPPSFNYPASLRATQ